jgi:hypothetical protein
MKTPHRTLALWLLIGLPGLSGCLGGESATDIAARKAAEGKAVGGACRHAGRAIEDCYVLNKAADKAAVFSGWREMNDYMRDKKMAETPPKIEAASPSVGKSSPGPDNHADDDTPAEKPARKVAKH